MDLGNNTPPLEIILFNKDGFIFSRVGKNNYKMNFSMENNNIVLSKVVDFGLIKLIYDLNGDVYEKVTMETLNSNEVIVSLLMKHLFEDLGLPQKYSFIHVKKIMEQHERIVFKAQSIQSYRPDGIPAEAELMVVDDLTCNCNIITPHKIDFSFAILFDSSMKIPPFADKLVGLILNKIFKRVKQFIENVRL
jgi:uncharacterized protein YkvS